MKTVACVVYLRTIRRNETGLKKSVVFVHERYPLHSHDTLPRVVMNSCAGQTSIIVYA
jgi:hypothetical protein